MKTPTRPGFGELPGWRMRGCSRSGTPREGVGTPHSSIRRFLGYGPRDTLQTA